MTAIEFDPAKDEGNIAKHGVSLSRASDFEILHYVEDDRTDYGETRYRAWGLLDDKWHCLAFTVRNGRIRAISLRRASTKEIERHVPESGF